MNSRTSDPRYWFYALATLLGLGDEQLSLQYRRGLIDTGRVYFEHDSQETDLLDPQKTQTQLIAALGYLVLYKGWEIEFTAIHTDHHDDSDLNPTPPFTGTHAGGWDADLWPVTGRAGNYFDTNAPAMANFLRDCANVPFLHQIGLAGSAWTDANVQAAGETVFHDDGGDHIHLGTTQ